MDMFNLQKFTLDILEQMFYIIRIGRWIVKPKTRQVPEKIRIIESKEAYYE